jgi:hypothetical protein
MQDFLALTASTATVHLKRFNELTSSKELTQA